MINQKDVDDMHGEFSGCILNIITYTAIHLYGIHPLSYAAVYLYGRHPVSYAVLEKLQHMNINKSTGPDLGNPRIFHTLQGKQLLFDLSHTHLVIQLAL